MARGSNSNPRVYFVRLAVLLLCFTILPGTLLSSQTTTVQHVGRFPTSLHAASLPSNRPFDYILIIVMENKNFSQINGSSSAPYLNQLAHNYSLATQYSACDHPSLPNYMCLTGGNNYFNGTNCNPVGSCTTGNPSIVDRIESSGLTWRAYMEDMPSPCFKSAIGNYTYLTNPFIFYNNIGTNSTRCASHVVPANSGGKGLPDDNLVNALNSTSTASNFMWLTPNLCNNMHDCSISKGDNYLSKLVPLTLNSYIFKTQKAALFITFDEGYGHYSTDYVFTLWAGSAAKTHYVSSFQYSHYSLSTTIELAWGLQPLTTKIVGSPMTEFLVPTAITQTALQANFTFRPSNPDVGFDVIFTGSSEGGKLPYNFTWNFGDGDEGTGQLIDHAYIEGGNYTVSLTVADGSRQRVMVSRALSIDTDPIPDPSCQHCATAKISKATLLMISFVVGLMMPLAGSIIYSRKRRRPLRSYDTTSRPPAQRLV